MQNNAKLQSLLSTKANAPPLLFLHIGHVWLTLKLTSVDKLVSLQVEAVAVTLPPQARHGGIEPSAAVELYSRQRSGEMPLLSGQPFSSSFRRHPERQVAVRDGDVARVVAVARVAVAALAVPPRVRLVPIVGADGHGEEAEGAERQQQARAGQQLGGGGHLSRLD